MPVDIHPDELASLLNGDHGSPYQILGPQPGSDAATILIRAFQPGMEAITVVDEATNQRYPMSRLRSEGLFEISIPAKLPDLKYHYEAHTYGGEDVTFHDPYAFPLQITDYDIYLWRQGRLL
ncbi:MAG: hypothetical protein ABI835_17250, partial [Chloroflexota bacterium]